MSSMRGTYLRIRMALQHRTTTTNFHLTLLFFVTPWNNIFLFTVCLNTWFREGRLCAPPYEYKVHITDLMPTSLMLEIQQR
jgi:hypothetical protein